MLAYHIQNTMSITIFVKGYNRMTANNEIKSRAKEKGVRLWEIADEIGLIDSSFSRKLRRELPRDEKDRILAVIDNIAAKRESAANR